MQIKQFANLMLLLKTLNSPKTAVYAFQYRTKNNQRRAKHAERS
ncbi:Uncharacterised protein [Legionella moravica]|uniref:Uncharacterized protein n=1 Tax=Legionella moravica TaxID=39962 RepID=A0A378JYN6_9GAMM|nr:Uncharacterised protein [Legionella moravica]